MRFFIVSFFIFVASVGLLAFDEPWERTDIVAAATMFDNKEKDSADLSLSIVRNIVDYYQSTQSKTSVSRCPFHTSCSSFLPRAVEVYGLPLGTLAFLDRYLFRENKSAFANYPLKRRPDGVYKLDDDYYLSP